MFSRKFDVVAKYALGVVLLGLWVTVCGGRAHGQLPGPADANPKELHGGIEIALNAVRAIALRVSTGAEGDNIKILSSDQITPTLALLKDDKPTPEYIRDLVQTVHKTSESVQRDFRIPPNQIHFLGLCELGVQIRDALSKEIRDKTSREITFLDAKSETELSIAGNIPRRYKLDGKWYDNRTLSLLIEFSATNIRV